MNRSHVVVLHAVARASAESESLVSVARVVERTRLHPRTVTKALAVLRDEKRVKYDHDGRGYMYGVDPTVKLPSIPRKKTKAPSKTKKAPAKVEAKTPRDRALSILRTVQAGVYEIGAALGLRRNDAQEMLRGLVDEGKATRERDSGRWVYRAA